MTPASQIFFLLRRDADGAVFAFDTTDGLTVPVFSSMELGVRALKVVAAEGHAVTTLGPMLLESFAAACRGAGAKFVQLDPLEAALPAQGRHLTL